MENMTQSSQEKHWLPGAKGDGYQLADVGPKLNAYQREACIYWKWQNYRDVLLAVLNAQWREGFEHTVITKDKNTTQLSQETQNLPVAKGTL
jgi:hypothetical protein